MAKNILQDIKPLTKKSTRVPRSEEALIEESVSVATYASEETFTTEPPRKHHVFIWLALAGSLAALFFGLSFFFASATVTLVPKSGSTAIDATFTATQGATGTDLAFEVMSVDGEEKTTIAGGTASDVKQKASGQVIIYNTYSTAAQKLIATTRLADKDGKIFRITEGVTVPGTHVEGGKTVPGSATVTAVADVAGPEYNIGLADFTIPGLKGSAKYEKIYARSKTPIAGGTDGKSYSLDAAASSKAVADLSKTVADKLWNEASAEIPKGYVAFRSLSVFVPTPPPAEGYTATTADITVVQKGTLTVFLLDEKVLQKLIAGKVMNTYDGSDITVPNLRDLTYTSDVSTGVDLKTIKRLSVHVTGTAQVIYSVDKDAIREALAGKQKSEFDKAMGDFAVVHAAELSLRPFWERSLPDATKKITVNIKDPFKTE